MAVCTVTLIDDEHYQQATHVSCTPNYPVKPPQKLLVSKLVVEGMHFRTTMPQKDAMLTARALTAAGHTLGQERCLL